MPLHRLAARVHASHNGDGLIRRCAPAIVFSLFLLGALVATVVTPSRADDPPAPLTVTVTHVVTSTYRARSAASWASAYRRRTRQLQAAQGRSRALRRTLLTRPSVSEAINLAAAVYGNGSWLWRVARCESGLNPGAVNGGSGSSGLFQFIPSTFATTPFGSSSIWSPYASALAAGWMASRGRASEWVCR